VTTDSDRKDGEPFVGTPGELLQKAVWHYNERQYPTAAVICQGIIASFPENAEAFHILGHIATRTQEFTAAISYFMRAVSLDQMNPTFSRSFAECLENAGRTDQAILAWSQYVVLKPDEIETLRHLANLQLGAGQPLDAVKTLQGALNQSAEDPAIQYQIGLAFHHAGEPVAAVEQFKSALLGTEPGKYWPECESALSAAMRGCGRIDEAIAYARLAVSHTPELASAHNNLGLALLDAGEISAAKDALDIAMRLRPDDPEIINNLGVILTRSGQHDQAEMQFRNVLRLRPNWAHGHLNLANSLREEERLDEAIEQYRAALASAPDDYRILGSLALAQLNMNRPDEAIIAYERALGLAPENAELRKGLGIAQLLSADFKNGWCNYESRLKCTDVTQRQFNSAPWDGAPLENGKLLVHAEQGFGDTLQFSRYVPMLSGYADTIVFECQRPLADLMNSLDTNATIVARGDPLPASDAHVALMSLPGLSGTVRDNIPNQVPYLSARSDQVAEWSGRMVEESRPRIGIVWAGNPSRQDDRMRSCPLSALTPIMEREDIFLASLQMDASDADRALLRRYNIRDFSKDIKNFTDTAAAITALDHIITVDTATAHLAGALGKPVSVLLGYAADWRYMLDRTDSPWYPTMRLFRQSRRGDWDTLVQRVERQITASKP